MSDRTRILVVLLLAPVLLLSGIWWSLRDGDSPEPEGPRRPAAVRTARGQDPALEQLLEEGAENGRPRPVSVPVPDDAKSEETTREEAKAPGTPTAAELLRAELANAPAILEMRDIRSLIEFDGHVRLHDSLAGARIEVSIRDAEGDGVSATTTNERLPALLGGLERGLYTMEVSAERDGVLVRARRTIAIGEGPVEIPVVELVPMAGVRARVVDAYGTPVPQARILVVRPEELEVGGRRIEPDPDGWVHYADLEPGVDHRLVVDGLPDRVERVVRVPREPRGTAVEEVRCASRLVGVQLLFRATGDAPLPPEVVELAIPSTGYRWGNCEELPARLLPGDYEFRSGDLFAVVTIPPGHRFEKDVRLESGK